ncbi:thiamine phosphate synthase [Evansella sp. LMS18]|uniref:thiamine phosphate synthase n=1 Tax=Evansella sp. LMS18 TaxID=2924033 RepID=UPI0020D1B4CD|nr:thiamine phosphate synthase [Evansella sp. LMS18]UTR09815.1 thiamine phosphate synthase [Evansella sp. LMS18]
MNKSAADIGKLLEVYFIMGSTNCKLTPYETLKAATEGGITLFQFREKGPGALTGIEKYELAAELQQICNNAGVPFIVNDDVDLAIELNADGVHIGQDDENIETVRKRLGDKIIGVSAHTMEEVKGAVNGGADYIGIGPVYQTATKPDAEEVQGTKLIEAVRNSDFDIPIVGIGGITQSNAEEVTSNGADGVSVITAISHSADPKKAASELAEAVRSGKKAYKN